MKISKQGKSCCSYPLCRTNKACLAAAAKPKVCVASSYTLVEVKTVGSATPKHAISFPQNACCSPHQIRCGLANTETSVTGSSSTTWNTSETKGKTVKNGISAGFWGIGLSRESTMTSSKTINSGEDYANSSVVKVKFADCAFGGPTVQNNFTYVFGNASSTITQQPVKFKLRDNCNKEKWIDAKV